MVKLSIELVRKSRIAGGVLAAALAGIFGGCVTTAPDSVPAATRPGPPLLWTAAKDGRQHYLFGTVHVGVDAKRDLAPEVWRAFARSDCFVMEADLAEGASTDVAMLARQPAGTELSSQVKPSTWTALSERVPMAPAELDRLQPWFATLLFMRTLVPEGEAMDAVLQAEATATGKRLAYLETWREALTSFAKVTTASDLDDLVAGEAFVKSQTNELLAAYVAGDEAQLMRVVDAINAVTPDSQAKMDALLRDRNDRWRPKLKAALSTGHCFVAVGAAHLVGEHNLRQLLTADGFTVRRHSR